MSKVEYSVRLRKLRQGEDGAPGQSAFKSIVFRRLATQPPTPTGGSYASPVPSGWSDGIPDEFAGRPCWMSSRVFTSNGLPPQTAEWTEPQLVSDTADVDICFSASPTRPASPVSHGTQNDEVWHETATEDDIWMAVARCSNGAWGAWSISKIKGEDGASAITLALSVSNATLTVNSQGSVVGELLPLVASQATLYAGGDPIPSSSVQWSVEYTGCRASVSSAGLVLVTSVLVAVASAKVTVHAIYDEVEYTAAINISKAYPGQDGVGTYALALDNDNINIGLVAEGGSLYPVDGYNVGESGIYIAAGAGGDAILTRVELLDRGDTALATATASAPDSYANPTFGYSVELAIDKITVTVATDVARAKAERISLRMRGTISVDDGGGARMVYAYKTLGIVFQPPGTDGYTPVVYELKPSAAAVVLSASGVPTPSQVSCAVTRRVGDAYGELTDNEMDAAGLSLLLTKKTSAGTESTTDAQVGEAVSAANLSALKWTLKKGESVYDEEELPFVKDGQPGTSPIFAKLDDDNITIGVDADGAPLPGELPFSTEAHLFKGNTSVPASWSALCVNCSVTLNSHSGALRVDSVSASATSAMVEITGTYQSADYKTTLHISKAYPGENGKSPVLYTLEPSINVVHRDAGGSADTSSVSCVAYRHVGESKSEVLGKYLEYITQSYAQSVIRAYSGPVPITLWTRFIKFALYDSMEKNELLASVNVPVVSDGLKGSPGPAGLTYRKTEWAAGVEYRNDTELLDTGDITDSQNNDGVWYIDIVTRTDGNGKLQGMWQCELTHTSDVNNAPWEEQSYGTTSVSEHSVSEHWREINTLTSPICTPLILADGAVIGFIQGNQLKIYDKDKKDEFANPFLRAGIQAASGDYPIFYANPSINEDPKSARWQQFENGSAMYGIPDKSRIYLNAAPSTSDDKDALPKMEVYNKDGEIAAIFDGSTITEQGELYGNGSTEGIPGDAIKASRDPGNTTFGRDSNSSSVSFNTEANATIVIPSRPVALACTPGPLPSTVASSTQYATTSVLVDGVAKATFTREMRNPNQTYAEAYMNFPNIEVPVSPGTHRVDFQVSVLGYGGISATAELRDTENATFDFEINLVTDRLMCRYFANGLAIGSTTQNYCMVWDNNGVMNLLCKNNHTYLRVTADGVEMTYGGEQGHGLRVTADGVEIRRKNTAEWQNL